MLGFLRAVVFRALRLLPTRRFQQNISEWNMTRMTKPAKSVNLTKAALASVLAFALNGMAHAQTAQSRLAPEETYAVAREAYLFAYPIVSMDFTMRQATNVPDAVTVNMRAPVNQFAHA